MKKRIKKAFTLVELLVVIAILAVLSTVAVVGYNSFTEKAQKSADQQAVAQFNTVVDAAIASGDKLESGEDAYAAIIKNGYDGGFKTAYGAYSMAWYDEEKAVVLVTGEAVAYPEEYAGTTLDKISPLYTVTPTTEAELKDAFAGKGSNYVNINIPAEGLEINNILEVEKNVTAIINLEGDVAAPFLLARMRNHGDLTINGNGHQMIGVVNYGGATLEVNNAKLGHLGSKTQAVSNLGGEVILNDVTFVNDSVNILGDPNFSYVVNNHLGTTTLNNCTYVGNSHGIFASTDGEIIVNGGTYTLEANSTGHIFWADGGTIEVNSGTFTQNSNKSGAYMIWAEHSAGAAANEVVTINGGTFNDDKYYFNGAAATLEAFRA